MTSSSNAEVFHKEIEKILNETSLIENIELQQNDEKIRNSEPSELTTAYQQPSQIYQQPSEIYLQDMTEGTNKHVYITDETTRYGVSASEEEYIGKQHDETEEPQTTISVDNNVEVTIASQQSDLPINETPNTPNKDSNGISRTEATIQDESSILRSPETQENIAESSSYAFQRESGEILSSELKTLFTKIANRNNEVTTNYDEAFDEKTLAAAAPVPNSMSYSAEDETQINTTAFYNEDHSDRESGVEMTQNNAMKNVMEYYPPKYDEMDPTMLRATNGINAPPINYYSPNDRILDYVKSHHVNNGDKTTVNFMRKSSSNYARLSDDVASNQDTAAATNAKHEMKASNSISLVNETRRTEVTASFSSADVDSLPTQQLKFQTGDVIKIHEVTTEVQKTHEKTVYFQPRQFGPEDDLRTNSPPAISYEAVNVASSNDNFSRNSNNNDGNYDPSDKKIDNVGNVAAETSDNIVSATALSSDDVFNTLQIFPSSSASEDSIVQLQKSQLYYISDGVKLPLEIRRLKDGTYALSISKDICDQILKKKCCVPLQGCVVQSPRPDTRANDFEGDHQSTTQTLSSTTTLRNTLQKLEEEAEDELNVHWFPNGRRKRDLIEDDSVAIVSMSVLDFARKYNLSLDFDEEQVALNELRSREKVRNFGDSLKQITEEAERNRLEKENHGGDSEVVKDENKNKVEGLQGSVYTRDENVLRKNVENLTEGKKQKSITKASRSEKTKDDQQSVNVGQIMDPGNQVNSITKGTDIFEGETKFKSNEIKFGKLSSIKKNNYLLSICLLRRLYFLTTCDKDL